MGEQEQAAESVMGEIDLDLEGDGDAGGDPAGPADSRPTSQPSQPESLTDRLLSTEPNPPLQQVESPWNPELGGPARMMRGVQKIGDIDGLPAVVDLVIGAVETYHSLDVEPDGDPVDGGESGTTLQDVDAEVVSR